MPANTLTYNQTTYGFWCWEVTHAACLPLRKIERGFFDDVYRGQTYSVQSYAAVQRTTVSSLDSIHQTDILLSQDISLFLYEISWWNVHKCLQFLRKKPFKIEWVGFGLGASHLECITLTPTPPRIWWRIPVWFKYITLTLTLLCVRIINVSTSVWRMELSVDPVTR